MSRRFPHRLTTALVCSALLVGACSNSDDDPDTADTTSTSAEPADTTAPTGDGPSVPSTTEPIDPALEAAMEAAHAQNLNTGDFPSGWQNLPPSEAEVSVVQLCTTVDLDALLVAHARSDAFSYSIEPGTLQASSAVTQLADEAAAEALVADFRTDEFVDCATNALARNTDTYTVSGALTRNDSEPGLADESVALSGDFVISPTDGSPDHTLSAVVVAMRRGDTVITFSSSATDRAPDEELLRSLLTTLDGRIGN